MKTGLARLWAHLACDARAARRQFPDAMLDRIEQVVADGERLHGAELRIAIEASLPWRRVLGGLMPRERAVEAFAELRVWDTEANNGVLLYLLLADHAIELVADRAASAALGAVTMQQVCEILREAFRDGRREQGLLQAIALLNGRLAEAFPPGAPEAEVNELPNRPAML